MSTPAVDWREVVSAEEESRFIGHAEYIRELQRKRARPERGLHVKANVSLTAELSIDGALPPWAQQGLGAKPGRYPAWVRVSNGAGARQHDRKGDIRGFAVKVIGVEGRKLIPGMEQARTQDFLFINRAAIATRTADEFIALIKAMQNPLLLVPKLIGSVGLGRALAILKKGAEAVGVKMVSVATTTYYSAAPIAWGPHAVKLSLAPHAKDEPGARPAGSPNYLGEELVGRVKAAPVTYDFRIQPYVDARSTPIEEHDVEWQSPWLKVGTLAIAQQDPESERGQRVSGLIEQASFDPWHALVEHRPLGNVMRARNHAYRLSTQEREAAPEPQDLGVS